MRGGSWSLDQGELAGVGGGARSLDLEDVEAGRDVEVVLGAQVPGHEAFGAAVLAQGLDQVPAHGVDADRRVERNGAELDASLAAPRDREARGLEARRADVG